jgi:hypothetical protein
MMGALHIFACIMLSSSVAFGCLAVHNLLCNNESRDIG